MLPRVTFDDLYPRATTAEEPLPGIVKLHGMAVGGRKPCWVCGRPTRWASLSFERHVCSAVCDGLGWARYWRADPTGTSVGEQSGT